MRRDAADLLSCLQDHAIIIGHLLSTVRGEDSEETVQRDRAKPCSIRRLKKSANQLFQSSLINTLHLFISSKDVRMTSCGFSKPLAYIPISLLVFEQQADTPGSYCALPRAGPAHTHIIAL